MQALRTSVALATLVAGVGCGRSGQPPALAPIDDQTVAVGEELVLVLTATDEDQDELFYDFEAAVADIQERADLSRRPDGSAEFRWRPAAADVGSWLFDFTVTDGTFEDTITIAVEVRSAVGQNSAPVFREPLGTGTTLDLAVRECLELAVVVEDADSSTVAIAEEEPRIEEARLDQGAGLSATWSWCPTEAQIADDDDRFTLTLSADDGENPKTIKNYLIVLREPAKPDCPGDAPVVSHIPADESTMVGLTIAAEVSDDAGLKSAPLLYYGEDEPATPVDVGALTQVSMELISGDMQDGTWAADVPNPVAGGAPGASAEIYYVIVAGDDDDSEGDCDHLTQAPTDDSYHITVTNPGGEGGAGLCEPCTADTQCGGAGDHCVRVGTGGDSFCLRACSGDGDCPGDYGCSGEAVESVDGAEDRQCIPDSGACVEVPPTCTDDDQEDNDSRTQVTEAPFLAPGTYDDLVSCPAGATTDDEDWYRIQVTAESEVTAAIDGGAATDLDLALYDSTGTQLDKSTTLTSTESLTTCLAPGTYFLRVYAYTIGENSYTLTYGRTAGCPVVCEDDEGEPDDNDLEARTAEIYPDPFISENNMICAMDDDWFAIEAFTDEVVEVDLTFLQTAATEDLDLHFYDVTGVDLTPCSEEEPTTCTAAQGQGASSNEHYEHTVTGDCVPCIFYVVVHGWRGSENIYDLRIGIQ